MDLERVKDIKVIILGLGVVGSYLLDCLYRSGVSPLTIVDYDKFDETNRNRQIGSDRVGEFKVDIFKELYPSIKTITGESILSGSLVLTLNHSILS